MLYAGGCLVGECRSKPFRVDLCAGLTYALACTLIGNKNSDSYISQISEIADSAESAVNTISNHFANINKLFPSLQTTDFKAHVPPRPFQATVSEYEAHQY